MYRHAMIGQTRVRLLGVVGVIAITTALALIIILLPNGFSSEGGSVLTVSGRELIDPASEEKLNEAGIFITDYDPPFIPILTLEAAAAYLKDEANVESESGALVMLNDIPANPNFDGFLRGTRTESLVWAIRVDTSKSVVPDLFEPSATGPIAFVDTADGELIGVVTQ